MWRGAWAIVGLIVAIFLLMVPRRFAAGAPSGENYASTMGEKVGGAQSDKKLVDRLSRAGWVLYSQPGCPYCQEQLRLFGGEYPSALSASSRRPTPAISDFTPSAVPTWLNALTGEVREGVQTREELERMSARK